MSVASVGVRLSDDFENLPLFETPPLNGPTNQIGTAVKGASLRAVEKQGDFILLEADSEDGSGGGTLGWADASCVVPTSFPALYEFASDLPDAVSLVVRASPKAGAGELGKVFGKGSLVMATGMQGDYISMAHQDRDDSAAPPLRGWMLTATDDRVLLSVKPAFLVVPAPGLPDGVQLRVRAAPEGTAAEVRQVPAAPGTIFEVAEQAGEWLRVLMGDAPSAWMSSAAQGMPLLRPARKDLFVMDPALIAQHGNGVKLAVRNAPSTEGVPLGEITSRGRVYCVGTRGPWLRVLYHGHREAWMLSQTPTAQLLVPAASISASSRSKPPTAAQSAPKPKAKPEAKAKAAPPSRRDGNRYMVCARRVTVRQFPEFYAQDVGVVLEGAVVRVFEEKEEINEAKQTKDVWVRGESPNTAAAAGSSAGLVEGWLLAFSTKRGAMVADAADALAAQHTFEKQENTAAAAAKPAAPAGPSQAEQQAAQAAAASAATAAAAAASSAASSASVGGYMRAAGHLKVREEADPLSLELSTVSRGELVKVEETSGLWVRVLYRGRRDGWVLTANKRGSMLSPAEAGPAAAAQEFQAQESAAASGAAAANSAATAEEDRPLTGAKGGAAAASNGEGGGGALGGGAGGGMAAAAAGAAAVAPPAAVGSGRVGAASVGQFLTSAGPLKVREEADPFSLDVGVIEKGNIVKVLETSDLWVRVSYRGREDGWALTANKRGPVLLPAEGGPAAASRAFDAQEAAFAAAATATAAAAAPPDGDDRPLTGAKPKPGALNTAAGSGGGGGDDDRPLNTGGGGGKGAWAPPSEFPPGHEGTSGFSGDRGGSKPIAAGGSAGGPAAGAGGAVLQFMTALGFVKVREEADPFSMDLGSVKKGDIVKVLETSDKWARVSYRGREDGWVLTANKRGPTLTPSEDQASAAGEFDAQEAAYAATAANTDGALPEDPADRPLTGAKPPPAAAAAADSSGAASEDRPLTGGGKGAWVPPSEFPPGHEEGVSSSGGAGGGGPNPKEAAKSLAVSAGSASGSPEGAGGSAQYMAALGFVKVREEADPFSMDLGSVKKGDIVKVLETSEKWARVSYRGREDGWVLTANKRGPTLVPSEDQASAAGEFDAQEAAFAAAAASTGGALPEDPADRPLTGAKPPPAAAAAPADSSAAASEDRPLTGGGKGAWVPPSEFPPGHEESASSSAGGGGGSGGGPSEMKPKEAVTGVAASAGAADGSSAGAVGDAQYMAALGFVKVREEADPFSMDLGSVKKGDIVKVLETSEKWARVSYRGREDGWVLTANKRGPTLTPSEDQASAAGEFDAQEAAFAAAAASTDGALPEDPADRPLTGAKPPPAAAAAADSSGAASEDRPLTGGGKGAWVPPSEFPPGHEEGLSPSGVGGGSSSGDAPATKAKAEPGGVVAAAGAAGGSSEGGVGSAQYMAALGFVKVREEADPFSMDLGSVKKGDIVKVLETSKLWARVSYRGREDGWVLTANKRGQTFTPCEDQASAAAEFDAQEAAFAAAAAATDGALPEDPADRPLTGAKPPPAAAAAAAASEDRPLTGGGKGAWVPPSEFPPGHEEGVGGAGGGGSGGDVPEMEAKAAPAPDDTVAVAGSAGGSSEGADGSAKYMAALGFVKVREEADPFSMDLGSVKKGDIVKVLETSKLWARVSYRGREDGWVLTANKRGPTLVPSEDQASAAGEFDAQEAAFAAAAASTNGALPEDPADRPLTGAKPPPPAAAAAEESAASEDRPLAGVGKGAWVPPSEFPPGHEEKVGGAGGGDDASGLKPPEALEDGGGAAGAVGGVAEDAGGSAQYMTALGFVKVREEADPFSMDLGSVKKGDVVKVLETSELWARVSYRGREDGWVLTANKRGQTFTPCDDQTAAAAEFDAQEAAFAAAAAATAGAPPDDPADRPLTGAKPPPAAAAAAGAAASEDRPLTGGGRGAWVPPSEFPPGHEEGAVSSEGGASGGGGGGSGGSSGGAPEAKPKELAEGAAEFMTSLGFVKVREEADPFSMDLGSVKKGDIVKVLETSDLWARVSYRGREDGWVLTANKRGPTLVPSEDQASAAGEFDAQEAAFAAAAANTDGALPEDPADRPLTGAKPPPAAAAVPADSSGAASEDRPLTGGGKGAWVPPSEFPPGHEESASSSAGGSDAGGVKTRIVKPDPEDERPSPTSAGEKEAAVGGGGDAQAGSDSGTAQYMTALGMIRLREEADPFSMDLGALKKGDVVKVLEMDGLWARVGYRGKTDGWVLTANKRGAMLAAADSQEEAAATWSEQERQASKGDGEGDPPAARDDRPIGGKRPAQPAAYGSDRGVDNDGVEVLATAAAAAAAASSAPGAEGSAVDGLDGNVSPSASATEAAGGAGLKPWQRRRKPPVSRKLAAEKAEEGSAADGAQSAEAAPPAKPWQRKKTAGTGAAGSAAEADGAAEGGVLDDGRQAGGGAAAGADSVKPWLRKKRPGGATAAPINVGSGGEGGDDASVAVAAKPWKAAAAKGKADGGTVQGAAPGGAGADHGEEGSVEGLEECLEERDWKKRVAAFEAASRACRNGGGGAAATVGPLLPRMLQDKNVQAVDAAVETLGAYLSLRSTMGADEGATLASALAERALCCGKGSVESKADTAADALLGGGSGDLARRGAWLALAARAGGLENEFFPPPPSLEGGGGNGGGGARGKSKAAIAAAAPKAVSGCVRAMSAAIKPGGRRSGAVAGGGDARQEVYTAAKSMLGSSKLPVKMAGVSLAAALYAAEGSGAIADLGVEDMESRIKAQLERAFADADAAAKTAAVEDTSSAVHPQTEALDPPPSPPIRPETTPRNGGGTFDLLGDDDGLELLTPPPPPSSTASRTRGYPAEGPADVAAAAAGGSGGISSISTDGSGSLVPPGGNRAGGVATAEDGSPHGSAFDDLCSEDGPLESSGDDDDDRKAGRRDAAGSPAGASFAATKVAEVDDPADAAAAAASTDLPDLRMITDSPSPDYAGRRRRRTSGQGAGGAGATSARLALGERLAAARGRAQSEAAADAAPAEEPRAFASSRPGAADRRGSLTPGFRGSARKSGVRTSVERETQFLGTQMLVLPEGERSAWDDILADMLLKAPPADPMRWRQRHHRTSVGGSPTLRAPGTRAELPSPSPPPPRSPFNRGRREEDDARRVMPPPPPPPPPGHQAAAAAAVASAFSSTASSPAASLVLPEDLEKADGSVDGHGGGAARRSLSFEVDERSSDGRRRQQQQQQQPDVSDDGLEDQGEPPSSLPESASSSFRLARDDRESAAEGGGGAEGKPSSWDENPDPLSLRSSADESVRERMAKFGARQRARQLREQRQTISHAEDLYAKTGEGGVSAEEAGAGAPAESVRPLLRAPGSWTSGVGVGNGTGGLRSPRMGRGGTAGGSNSLGSPSSSSNLVVTQAALGNLTNNLASLMSTKSQVTSENRENRRQSISRRLTRGASLGAGRLPSKEAADLGAVEEAEAVALGASPVAARAAAEAAAEAETIAIRRRVMEERQARRKSRGPRGMTVEAQEEGYPDVSPARGGGDGGGGGGGVDALEVADAGLESEGEEYATPRERRGSPESVASTSSARRGRRQQQGGEPSAAGSGALRGNGGGGRGGGTGFFGQQVPESHVRSSRQSSVATPRGFSAGTPVDSPRSGSDSDAAYDSLRGVLRKVSLAKYFKEFRRREVRLEDLQHLTEGDLTEMGMPVGPRKRLLVEIHGVATPLRSPATGPRPLPAVVVPPAASPSSPPQEEEQQEGEQQEEEQPLKAARSPRLAQPGTAIAFPATKRAGSLGGAPRRATGASTEALPAPARSLASRRADTAVSASSLRARLSAQRQKQGSPRLTRSSLSPRPSPHEPLRARTSSEGAGGGSGFGVTSDESFESGLGQDDASGGAMADVRPGRASSGSNLSPRRVSSSSSGLSAGLGGRLGRAAAHRSTIGGSGAAARRAQAVATAAAMNSAAAAIENATGGAGGGGGGSRLPRRSSSSSSSSGIPRKVPVAAGGAPSSRLAAPATASSRFGSRSGSIAGGSVGRGSIAGSAAAMRAVQAAGEYDPEDDASGTGSIEATTVDESTQQADGAASASGRRSFIPRPSPKSGRSMIPRRSGRA